MKNMCWTVTFNWARGWRNGCEHAVSLKLADRSNKIKISFLIQSIVGSSELNQFCPALCIAEQFLFLVC